MEQRSNSKEDIGCLDALAELDGDVGDLGSRALEDHVDLVEARGDTSDSDGVLEVGEEVVADEVLEEDALVVGEPDVGTAVGVKTRELEPADGEGLADETDRTVCGISDHRTRKTDGHARNAGAVVSRGIGGGELDESGGRVGVVVTKEEGAVGDDVVESDGAVISETRVERADGDGRREAGRDEEDADVLADDRGGLVVDDGDDLVAGGGVAVDISGGPRNSVFADGEVSREGGGNRLNSAVVGDGRGDGRRAALTRSGDDVLGTAVDGRSFLVLDEDLEDALGGVSSSISDVDLVVRGSDREAASGGGRVVVVGGETAVVLEVGQRKGHVGGALSSSSEGGDGGRRARNSISNRSIVIDDGERGRASGGVSSSISDETIGSMGSEAKVPVGVIGPDGRGDGAVISSSGVGEGSGSDASGGLCVESGGGRARSSGLGLVGDTEVGSGGGGVSSRISDGDDDVVVSNGEGVGAVVDVLDGAVVCNVGESNGLKVQGEVSSAAGRGRVDIDDGDGSDTGVRGILDSDGRRAGSLVRGGVLSVEIDGASSNVDKGSRGRSTVDLGGDGVAVVGGGGQGVGDGGSALSVGRSRELESGRAVDDRIFLVENGDGDGAGSTVTRIVDGVKDSSERAASSVLTRRGTRGLSRSDRVAVISGSHGAEGEDTVASTRGGRDLDGLGGAADLGGGDIKQGDKGRAKVAVS